MVWKFRKLPRQVDLIVVDSYEALNVLHSGLGCEKHFGLLSFSCMALSFESHVLNHCLEIIVVISDDPYNKSISSDECQS